MIRTYWPLVAMAVSAALAVGTLVALHVADRGDRRRSEEAEAIAALRRLYAGLDEHDDGAWLWGGW